MLGRGVFLCAEKKRMRGNPHSPFLPFEEARVAVQPLCLTSARDWEKCMGPEEQEDSA